MNDDAAGNREISCGVTSDEANGVDGVDAASAGSGGGDGG
jgi:hypothetical protein